MKVNAMRQYTAQDRFHNLRAVARSRHENGL